MTRMDDSRAQIKAMDAKSFNISLTEPHRKNEFREKVLSLKGLVLTGRANTANGYSFSKSFEKSFQESVSKLSKPEKNYIPLL